MFTKTVVKELPQEVALRAVENVDDVLSERQHELTQRIGSFVCPGCNSSDFTISFSFTPADVLPRADLHCRKCGRTTSVSAPNPPDIEWISASD